MTTPSPESLWQGYSGRIFIAITIGWAGLQLGRGVIPPLLPTIMESLAFSPFLAGVALTVLAVANAACQFLGGRFADAWSRKTIIALALAVLIGGLAVLTIAVTYALFLAGVALVGIAAGLFFAPMRAALADVFIARRGEAYGVNEGVGAAATVGVAGLAAVLLLGGYWRVAFLPGLLIGIVGLVVLHRWHAESYVVRRAEIQFRQTFSGLLRNPITLVLLCAYSLVIFAMQGVFGFLPAMLQAERAFSPSAASLAYALIFVTGAFGMPLAGTVSDRVDRLAMAVGVTALAAIGLIVITLGNSVGLIVLGIVIFATGLLGFPPVMQSYLMGRFPDATMARDFGGFKTVYVGVGSLGPLYVGATAEVTGYVPAFWGLAACLFVSGLLIASVRIWIGSS